METNTLAKLELLLRLPGAPGLVADTSVLSCGCLVSETAFVPPNCPGCLASPVHILAPVAPMRELYRIVKNTLDKVSRLLLNRHPTKQLSDSRTSEKSERFSEKYIDRSETVDLSGLFCKYAKEEQAAGTVVRQVTPPTLKSLAASVAVTLVNRTVEQAPVPQPTYYDQESDFGLNETQERNFSQCFPFHRKVSTFQTQQGLLSLGSRGLIKNRFTCSAMTTYFDHSLRCEVTIFVLISDRRWELYRYTGQKPELLACGKLSGEYGTKSNNLKVPTKEGIVIRTDFAKKGEQSDPSGTSSRLKSWVQLFCAISRKYLVISGTKGVLRVLNIEPSQGEIGSPAYTYFTDFPIRCIAILGNSELVACGITTREKISNKQQPFIILHKMESKGGRVTGVVPLTITVPFRDPLKIITFNASSDHLLCCTVYEMRYFIIKLKSDATGDYRKPKLIFSDNNTFARQGVFGADPGGYEEMDEVLGVEDDDQMLDNEGITDIRFGRPFSNTIVISFSSMKSKPPLLLKINGPSIDSKSRLVLFLSDPGGHNDDPSLDNVLLKPEDNMATSAEVLLRITGVGSNIYVSETSPRGDATVFADKLGRILLVSTSSGQISLANAAYVHMSVVLIGEVSPAMRYTEAASICFSSDGGKVMAVDRKGAFHVYDFTKGIPGVDPEVIKCKIISV